MSSPGAATPEQLRDCLAFLQRLGWTHLPPAAPVATTTPAPVKPAPSPPPEPTAETVDLFETKEALAQIPVLPEAGRVERLRARDEELQQCDRCKLCVRDNSWANRLVYGVGSPMADIVFVGEGPGEEEDAQGLPFVGRAGELLTKIIGAMGLDRGDVYICNVVKHRAPKNRDPEADEIIACEPFLLEQLDIIRPKVLVTLGNCATKTLLRTKTGITKIRGEWKTYHGIPTMPTFHPAYLLRRHTRTNREAVWNDMRAVLAKLKECP